jgi:DNA (cytosine-5)-methyltransferase 1
MKAEAYYNEHDPFAAAWLRELIKEGHIAFGVVDERDIQDVKPDELRPYTQVHLFAGIGGWSYALRLAGWPDDRPVWTGSCPCQPFSAAGKRQGTADKRHLWPEMFRLVRECKPPDIFGEQVASKGGREWLSAVRSDLETLGYAVGAADLCAAGYGALHIRQRLWWCANASGERPRGGRASAKESWTREQLARLVQAEARVAVPAGKDRALADGLPTRMVELRGYGNAIVPQVAAAFVTAYMEYTDD